MDHYIKYEKGVAVVETTSGRVRGYEYGGVQIFKGIPYATAKRFHAPEPVKPWTDEFNATNFGYVCPLMDMSKPNGELSVPHRYWVQNEDCQNLNIWTPGCNNSKLPVMVWLHGGGFSAGSAIEQITYEGENMSRCGQVVVVTINHRLNILGYLDLSSFGPEYANSANAGTDDIVAALRWIKDNIAGFGGDPENVTLFGQSGGGAKITTLLQTPAADGLYARGIVMSGVMSGMMGNQSKEPQDTRSIGEALMRELNVSTVKELETVPYEQLCAAYNKVAPGLALMGKYVGNAPHPNDYYVGDPLEVGFRKETSQIPLIVGSTYGELTALSFPEYDRNVMTEQEAQDAIQNVLGKEAADQLIPLFKQAYPERHLIDLLRLDLIARSPVSAYVRRRSALNSDTYSYMFNLDMQIEGGMVPWHCADIAYVFHNTELAHVTRSPGVEEMEAMIFDTVMAFAKTGNPNNPQIPLWKPSTPDTECTMILDEHPRVAENYDMMLMPLYSQYMMPIFMQNLQKLMGQLQH